MCNLTDDLIRLIWSAVICKTCFLHYACFFMISTQSLHLDSSTVRAHSSYNICIYDIADVLMEPFFIFNGAFQHIHNVYI